MKTTKPKTITVFGRDIAIEKTDLKGETLGLYHHDDRTIYVDKKLKGRELKNTIEHERYHAILALSGLTEFLSEELEEAIVRAFEHALCK